ncbi:hypothetical protein E2K98_26660 [Bacillus salipaludis]|uniref:APC family permease n=1 Tax=Bacillus salipaludis TaxID=2547811 RepID=A0A4R5VIV0_9BACI|nr:APC family permease [Bacillus salipaludis]MDQ6597713.1 APC family permease [Bacillus salipaludis]TDK56323.1 hypothetical protein E2K98_26660 [Bacillus salipaludis]
MEYHSDSEEQHEDEEKMNDEEYRVSEYPTRQEARREPTRESRQSFKDRKKNQEDVEEKTEGATPSNSRSSKKIKKTKSKTKLEMSWVKLVFKIFVVAAVWYNFHFLLNYMKGPASPFTATLMVIGICAVVNFAAIWILFYKRAFIRFYLSLIAVIGSFAYYGYVNYTQNSFLGNNKITSLIVAVSVLMALNPRTYSFPRGIVFLLIPIVGIYFSGNQFALVWTLMFNAGLILMFRKSKANKSKDRKRKNEQDRKNKKQTA